MLVSQDNLETNIILPKSGMIKKSYKNLNTHYAIDIPFKITCKKSFWPRFS